MVIQLGKKGVKIKKSRKGGTRTLKALGGLSVIGMGAQMGY